MNYNKVILVGRITHDPELKVANDKEYLDFQFAVNRYGKDNKSDFFKIVCFGKTAEFVSTYVTKGRLLLVEGSLRDNQWTDEQGNKRRSTEIMAHRIQFMEKKEKQEEQLPSPEAEPMVKSDELPKEFTDGKDEEVPF